MDNVTQKEVNMMHVVVILIGKRVESAVKVQEVLTKNGDMIRTRLGINREPGDDSNGSGFIFLEVCDTEDKIQDLCDALNAIDNVKAECLKMELPPGPCKCT